MLNSTMDAAGGRAPNDAERILIETLKEAYAPLLEELKTNVPGNRERSMAIMNLEQSCMWATRAVMEG